MPPKPLGSGRGGRGMTRRPSVLGAVLIGCAIMSISAQQPTPPAPAGGSARGPNSPPQSPTARGATPTVPQGSPAQGANRGRGAASAQDGPLPRVDGHPDIS